MQSIITLSLLSLIPAIQGITCDNPDCYSITLDTVNYDAGNNAQCYTYTTSLSDAAECNAGANPKILFGVDDQTCYINTDDLASKVTSTTPFVHSIKDDDTTIIGIEFDANSGPFTICIKGIPTGSETTTGPLQITDDNGICTFASDIMPNYCGICDGDDASTSCFCTNDANECAANARPRGDLSCEWDTIRSRCIANEAPECASNIPTRPCVCFWDEQECDAMSTEGGRTDCGWDQQRQLCSPTDCIDTFNCNCLELEQDCESAEIIDFPQDCIWTIDDECIPFDGTTEIPESSSTTPEGTGCDDDCGCFDTERECDESIEELMCVWVDECIEMTPMPTKAPYDQQTRAPSISTTWQKPSKSWGNGGGGSGKGKGKGKGKKNGP